VSAIVTPAMAEVYYVLQCNVVNLCVLVIIIHFFENHSIRIFRVLNFNSLTYHNYTSNMAAWFSMTSPLHVRISHVSRDVHTRQCYALFSPLSLAIIFTLPGSRLRILYLDLRQWHESLLRRQKTVPIHRLEMLSAFVLKYRAGTAP